MLPKNAAEVVKTVRQEEPDIFDDALAANIYEMLEEAIACEMQFAEDLLSGGVAGLSAREMRRYLQFVADQRLAQLGLPALYHANNPFPFMELQDVQEFDQIKLTQMAKRAGCAAKHPHRSICARRFLRGRI
jgi:ribonucleoside-diphosphate reductase beta chain